MKLYLDTCCWGRPYDDMNDDADMTAEAEAVKKIAKITREYGYAVYGSVTVEDEINANRDISKRADIIGLYYRTVTNRANYVESVFDYFGPRARRQNIRNYDAIHLCYAIAACVDYLLTVDKDFLNKAAQMALPIKVINPKNLSLGGMI